MVLAKINIFHFSATSEHFTDFHFLLRFLVILFSMSFIFLKRAFRRLFRFWPPPGPKIKTIDVPGPPLGAALAAARAPGISSGAALAAEHAPGTPSGPSKNRSERKMKMLILHWFYLQNLSPDVLLPIQDPPKRPPMDLINFPEGPL